MESLAPLHKEAYWWRRLKGEDLITLQPLRALKLEPFELASDESHVYYFDAISLANYLIQSKHFHHPASRRVISRDECKALAAHLVQHHRNRKLGEAVLRAYDERKEELRVQGMSREEQNALLATELQRSMFEARPAASGAADGPPGLRDAGGARHADGGGSGRPPQSSTADARIDGSGSSRSAGRRRRGRGGPPAAAASAEWPSLAASEDARARLDVVAIDGNLAVIDDDLLPGQMSGAPAVRAAAYAASVAPRAIEPFPALPPAAPPRPAVTVVRPTPSTTAAPSAAAPATALSPAAAEAISRRRELAGAFGKSTTDGSSFAADSARVFDVDTLELARAQPSFVQNLEDTFDRFLESEKRTLELPPMPRQQRKVVHEMAKCYGISTISKDNEPRKFVTLYRTNITDWPSVRLSDAAKAPASATLAEDVAPPVSELLLTDVTCSESVLRQFLSFLDGEYALAWRRPNDGSAPSVKVTFASEEYARRARQSLGGGVRGSFRVQPPARAPQRPPRREPEPPSSSSYGTSAAGSTRLAPSIGSTSALHDVAAWPTPSASCTSCPSCGSHAAPPWRSRSQQARSTDGQLGAASEASGRRENLCARANPKPPRTTKPVTLPAPAALPIANQWAALGDLDGNESS